MPTSLQGIAKYAARQKGYRFRTLYGMLAEDFLQQCCRDIRKDAAAGVEQVSAQAYEQHLDDNIPDLVERLKQKRYRAKLVRRPYLPTGDGTQRPLGIPAVEEKRLRGVVCKSSQTARSRRSVSDALRGRHAGTGIRLMGCKSPDLNGPSGGLAGGHVYGVIRRRKDRERKMHSSGP
jgi:hypothetical protein